MLPLLMIWLLLLFTLGLPTQFEQRQQPQTNALKGGFNIPWYTTGFL
jgi:hypothetical protein